MATKTQPNQPMAILNWGYEYIMLPLESAHKIQRILAEEGIMKCSDDWGKARSMYTLTKYTPPDVAVMNREKLVMDLSGMTDNQRRKYKEEVLEPYRSGDTDTIMGIEEWVALLPKEN